MKKILYSILISLMVIFPVSVSAEGYISVSPSSLTIEQGSSKTFKITAYNTIGDVAIKSNNNSIVSVNTGSWGTGMVGEKETKSGTITVTGNSIGSTTISLTLDAATFDGEDLAGQTKTITVNVVAKPTPTPTTPNDNKPENNLSKNNNIKNLSIEGYELVKADNNNYTLSVTNDVTSIKVNATAEDSKAKVTGTGVKELKVGENNIEVIVTSESGAKNKINIKVTRKDGYYLEDLDSVLKNNKIKEADIIIKSDSKISKEEINKIKDSKKLLRLNYYNENKKLVYSWIINGNEIKDTKEFVTTITFKTESEKEIYKLSNYADGLYINFNHSGELSTGTKIKLFVGDKFENESIVNVYHYNNTEKLLELTKDSINVVDGYIELDIEHCSKYFVTMSTIGTATVTKEKNSPMNMFMIIAIVELFIIIGLVTFMVIKLKFTKKTNLVSKSENTLINPINDFEDIKTHQDTTTNINNDSNIDNDKSLFNDNLNETDDLNNNNNLY